MCILATSAKLSNFKEAELSQCNRANGDNWGLAYAKDGVLYTAKGDSTELSRMVRIVETVHQPGLVHFRIATTGEVGAKNTHPFFLGGDEQGPDWAFAHNGIIPGFGDWERSDTREVAEEMLEPLAIKLPKGEFLAAAEVLLRGLSSSKYVLLHRSGTIHHINSGGFHAALGCMWSNHSYEKWGSASADPRKWRDERC